MKWRVAAPLAASAAFSTCFIARSSFPLDGRRSFTLFDDAMVSMIYARNLAHGQGLVWNAGDKPVEGITNPLWTGVMALVHLGGLPDGQTSLAVMIVGAGLILVAALLSRAIVQELLPGARVAPILVLWLVVFYYPLTYWTLRGMEVGLVTALLLAGILYCLRLAARGEPGDAWRLAAVTAAGLWTRLDFAVFGLVFGAFAALCIPVASRRRALAIFAGVVFAALALQEAARVAYYHAWLPNTYFLKLAGFSIPTRLGRGATVLALGVTREYGVALAFAAVALSMPEWRRRAGLPLAVCAAAIAYSTWVGGDVWEWMGFPNRYVTPGVVALLGPCAVGIERLLVLRRQGSRRAWWMLASVVGIVLAASARWLELPLPQVGIAAADELKVEIGAASCLFGLGLLLAAVPLLDAALERLAPGRSLPFVGALCAAGLIAAQSLPGFSWWYAWGGAHVRDDGHAARFGRVLGSITDPEARIAVFLAGNPIYFSNRKGVDLLGKNDDRIAALPPRTTGAAFLPGHSKWNYDISVLHDRPDVVTELWDPTLDEVTRILDAGYVPVEPRDRAVAKVLAELRGRSWLLAREDSPHVRWDRVRMIEPELAHEWARKWLH